VSTPAGVPATDGPASDERTGDGPVADGHATPAAAAGQ
jgi:hypothetical protein